MKVKGCTAILTGATGGIGRAIAWELARRDASTLIVVGRNVERTGRLAAQLGSYGMAAHAFVGDIVDDTVPSRLAQFAEQHVGDVDFLINCAGVQNFGFFVDESARCDGANCSRSIRSRPSR